MTYDENFFNTSPLFKHLQGGVVTVLGDGWLEKSKVICEDVESVMPNMAQDYKLAGIGSWREHPIEKLVSIFNNHKEIKAFADKFQPGDKMESYVAFRDMLAASGGWRIVRDGKVLTHYRLWIS
jgi:hypothetical protein